MNESINIDCVPDGVIILEPQHRFNSAIIGYDEARQCLIYDFELLIEVVYDPSIASDKNDAYDQAVEYVCYNILGPQTRAHWPLIVEQGKIINRDDEESSIEIEV